MLVLTRRAGERIVIPALHTTIQVIKAREAVRLGVAAPKVLRVLREELMPNSDKNASLVQSYLELQKKLQNAHIQATLLGKQMIMKVAPAELLETLNALIMGLTVQGEVPYNIFNQ